MMPMLSLARVFCGKELDGIFMMKSGSVDLTFDHIPADSVYSYPASAMGRMKDASKSKERERKQ